MGRKIINACGGAVRGKTIAVLGLTFKPNTDDMRDAPSLSIIQAIQDAGGHVIAYDPEGMGSAGDVLTNVRFGKGPYDVAEGADALVIITEWNEFRSLDFNRLRSIMREPVLIDLRNIYRRKEIEEFGFVYDSVGRAKSEDFTEIAAE